MRFFVYIIGVAISSFSNNLTAKVAIMGKACCTSQQMQRYLLRKNPKVEKKYLIFPVFYLLEGKKEGVRGDLAFAQALHETNFFKFGGDVSPSQNNFCGLGATGGGVKGHCFRTPQEGIRAQIQHLKAYASKTAFCQPCIDPRFQYIKTRGCAPYIENLGGLWAHPGYDTKKYKSLSEAKRHKASYGDKIRKMFEEMHIQ